MKFALAELAEMSGGEVAGDHSLRTDLGAVAEAVRAWLLRQKPSVSGTRMTLMRPEGS
jgi:hypothetical protein